MWKINYAVQLVINETEANNDRDSVIEKTKTYKLIIKQLGDHRVRDAGI